MLQRLAEHRPHVRFLAARTGAEGLVLATARRPDLILVAEQLPDMPEAEVRRRLGEDERTRVIPVVVIRSARATVMTRRPRGPTAWPHLAKPLDAKAVLALLDRLPAGIATGRRE